MTETHPPAHHMDARVTSLEGNVNRLGTEVDRVQSRMATTDDISRLTKAIETLGGRFEETIKGRQPSYVAWAGVGISAIIAAVGIMSWLQSLEMKPFDTAVVQLSETTKGLTLQLAAMATKADLDRQQDLIDKRELVIRGFYDERFRALDATSTRHGEVMVTRADLETRLRDREALRDRERGDLQRQLDELRQAIRDRQALRAP